MDAKEFLISATLLDIVGSLKSMSSTYPKGSVRLFVFADMALGSNHSAYISIGCLAAKVGDC